MIDAAILEMHRGLSLRAGIKISVRHLPLLVRPIVLKTIEEDSPQHLYSASFLTKSVRKHLLDVLKIAQLKSNQLGRLKSFRDHIYIQNDFRHKSGQALLQTKIQAAFILILYVLILIFCLFQHPWHQLKSFVLSSGLMLALGILILHLITRKRTWKT